jgi:hypothetical protein
MDDDINGQNGQNLNSQMAQLLNEIQTLRAEQQADRTLIRSLQEISSISTAIPTPATHQSSVMPGEPSSTVQNQPTTSLSFSKKRETYPRPERFDGDRSKFRTWLREMKNKLEADGAVIGTARDQFNYIYACLAPKAQKMTISFVDMGGGNGAYNPQDFLNYLTVMFTDPNEKARALDRLRSLFQHSEESFATFIPKFEREMLDAGGTGWSDEVCINYLEGAVNDKIRGGLVSVIQIPGKYHEYVQLLQTIGSRLDGMKYSLKRRNQSDNKPKPESPMAPQTIASVEDPMEWESVKANRTMMKEDQTLQGKRAKWVSKEEMNARRNEQRCLRCGRSKCQVNKCPLLPARPPVKARKVHSTEVTEAAVEEEEEGDTSPEN